MNQIDVFILIVVGIPTVLGLTSGFLKNLFAFSGIVIGLFVATKYNSQIISYLQQFSWFSNIMNLISFVTVIMIFYFIGIFIARKLSGINFITSTIDKIAGAVFGMLQGLLIASLLLLFIGSFEFIPADVLENSMLYSSVIDFAPTTFNIVSGFFPNTKTFFKEMNILNDTIQ